MLQLILLVMTVLSLAACASAPKPPTRHDADTALEGEITRLMAAADVQGLAIARIENGQVRHLTAYGLADRERQQVLRSDSIMAGASFTKAVFAYLAMQLAAEGVFDLDAPLGTQLRKPLPDYAGFADLKGDARWRSFTPRMLLSHTSGMPNWRWLNPDRKLDIKFEPGSRYVYSGEGMVLMQLVVEERTGKPLADLLQARVFGPLGMVDTSVTWRPANEGRTVTRYDPDGKPLAHRKRSKANAGGSMDTTPADMARFLAAVLRGDGLKAAVIEQMLAVQKPIVSPQQFPSHWPGETSAWQPIGLGAGLGWITLTSPQGPVFFKEGHDDGVSNLMLGLRNQRSGIVLMSNSSNAERIFIPVLRAVYGELCLPWYWMNYIAYDVTLPADARNDPPVTAGCR